MIEVRIQLLLGKKVVDATGRSVGRILSVHAEKIANECLVTEYHLGLGGLLGRMGVSNARPKTIPWQLMDLSDPERPRLKVRLEELKS
jgi:hypothetical protein